MGTLLRDSLVAYIEDTVRIPDGGQAMSHDEGSLTLQQDLQGFLDQQFCLRVDGAGGLVQDHYGRIFQHDPGKADELPLARGQAAAPLLQHMLISSV